MRKEFLEYYSKSPATPEQRKLVRYLKNNVMSVFPYEFEKKYDELNIEVLQDTNGLHYVNHRGHRLYFIREKEPSNIKELYITLLKEQDPESPHCYLTENFDIRQGATVADIGAAEGILILESIDKIKKAYLFEADPKWIEALEATFAPWKEKVEIINKFVCDKDDEHHVSIDEFFADKERPDFIKIDIEGSEAEMFKGSEQMMCDRNPLQLAVCTYHSQNDVITFDELLQSKKFKTEVSKGFMLFMLG